MPTEYCFTISETDYKTKVIYIFKGFTCGCDEKIKWKAINSSNGIKISITISPEKMSKLMNLIYRYLDTETIETISKKLEFDMIFNSCI